MSSKQMIIDLAAYAGPKRKLLSGRENGKALWSRYSPQYSDPAVTIIVIKNDGSTIITNSYFLGLFSEVFKKFNSKQELLEHINFKDLNNTNKEELLRGINRGFSEVRNGMA